MEDGLVLVEGFTNELVMTCLNPYCSGRWSRTYINPSKEDNCEVVLILIVVEDGLVPGLAELTDEAWKQS